MNRNDYRQMLLSGTVCFPATFPQLAELRLKTIAPPPTAQGPGMRTQETLLIAIQQSGPRVRIKRSVRVCDVRAVFIPRDACHVNYDDGLWLLGDEINTGLQIQLYNCPTVRGIAFVPETAQTLLKMTAGMTAGESVQYYPPLPRDPSANHYTAWPPRQDCRPGQRPTPRRREHPPTMCECEPEVYCPEPYDQDCIVTGPYCEDDGHAPHDYGHAPMDMQPPVAQAYPDMYMCPTPCEEHDQ